MYAIVDIAGKQYRVSEGDTITTDKLEGKAGNKIFLNHVLLLKDDNSTLIGTPYLDGSSIEAEIIASGKGHKIKVSKFKAKVRYRRTTGHRQLLTSLKILSIQYVQKSEKLDKSMKVIKVEKEAKRRVAKRRKV